MIEEGDNWRPVCSPMRSAYASASSNRNDQTKEPDFTNFAKTKESPTFISTLDYIFLSPEWIIRDTLCLPHRDQIEGPLPNKEEPSDHLLLSAVVSL